MKSWVYLVRCRDGSLYAGWTNQLSRRLQAHNKGIGARYTRGRGPVTLVYAAVHEDKGSAMREEAALKKLTKRQKERLCTSFSLEEAAMYKQGE